VIVKLLAYGVTLSVSALLVVSGLAKLAARYEYNETVALIKLLPQSWKGSRVQIMRSVGVIEAAIGGTVLLWRSQWSAVFAVAFATACVGYLVWAKRVYPQSSCGCTSSEAPINARSFVRAGSLLLEAGWILVWRAGVVPRAAQLSVADYALASLLAVILCSAMALLGGNIRSWMAMWSLLKMRTWAWLHARKVTPDQILHNVEMAPFWAEVKSLREYCNRDLRVEDGWREGPWGYISYSLECDGSQLTVVAGQYLGTGQSWIRASVLSSAGTGRVLATWDSLLYQQRPISTTLVEAISKPSAGSEAGVCSCGSTEGCSCGVASVPSARRMSLVPQPVGGNSRIGPTHSQR
jgi:hypothetical protein